MWKKLGIEVHFVPTRPFVRKEPLFEEVARAGHVIHGQNEFDVIERDALVLGYCSRDYLKNLPAIRRRTKRTLFANCMTWLFDEEKVRHAAGEIGAFLYQNEDVLKSSEKALRAINPMQDVRYLKVTPYFERAAFPFVAKRAERYFGCGRISRSDADKFSKDTLGIYEHFVSPKPKAGLFLGFGDKAKEKIGTPMPWIRIAADQRFCTQQTFYQHCEIVLQPTDTNENWPRVGLEAMSSGSVLVVNNRGGWKRMVEHGKTGWLCDNPRDFIYYASKMAYEPDVRKMMSEAGRKRVEEIASMDESAESWRKVFEAMS